MKLYYPKSQYDAAHRGLVFPLLKPFIKWKGFTDAERIAIYGVSERDVVFVDTIEQADVTILPMAWQYYQKTKTTQQALDFITQCANVGKKVWTYNAGDFGVQTPELPHVIWFRLGGNRSQFTSKEYTIPPFIVDPLKKQYHTDTLLKRPYSKQPLVGFCGQANASRLHAVTDTLKVAVRNIKSKLEFSRSAPQSLLATSYVRASLLKRLEQSTEVQTNFILRKQYRAGVTQQKATHHTTQAFYDNINQTDYTLCVRGAGNFSVRFYETLAMGRIPVFVNTDCSLPFHDVIPWRKHVVWVEYEERRSIGEKVKAFHEALSETDFIALQHANRNLWKEQLTLGGFFKRFFSTQQK